MTGSLHHFDRPTCVEPEPPGPYPCHPALVALVVDDVRRDYCDRHGADLLAAAMETGEPRIQEVLMIDDHGGDRPWRRDDGTPDLRRAWRFAARAYVDYGCCLPGQIDPSRMGEHAHG